MRDLLAKNSRLGAATALSLLLSRLVGFVLMPWITHEIPPPDQGFLNTLALMGQVLALVAAQGMPSALFRAYSFSAKTDDDKRRAVATVFRYTAVSSLVLGGVLALAAKPLARAAGGEDHYWPLVVLVLLTYVFQNLKNTCAQILRADYRSREFLIVYCGEFIICVALNVWFVLVLKTGLAGIVYSNLIGVAMAFLLAAFFVPQALARGSDVSKLPGMLKFGLPLVPPGLAALLLDQFDKLSFRLLIAGDRSLELIGIYGCGLTIAQILQGVMILPLNQLWPGIYYDLGKRPTAARDLGRCATYYAAIAGLLATGLAVTSRPLVALMVDVNYHEAWRVVPFLAYALAFVGAAEITKAGLLIVGTTRPLPRMMGIAVAASIGLNYLLVPRLELLGPAIAALASYALLAVLHAKASAAVFKTDYEWERLLKVGIAAVVSLTVGLTLPYPEAPAAGRKIVDLLIRGGTVTVVYPLLLGFMGFFTSAERTLLRELRARLTRRRG